MTERLRVVIDTNILISRLLLKSSVPARAMDLAIDIADILISDAGLEELADVLSRPKFERYVSIEDRQEFMRRFMQMSQHVNVHSDIRACHDPRDDKFLELAVDGGADCILSGDEDLLSLDPFRAIRILSSTDFLQLHLNG